MEHISEPSSIADRSDMPSSWEKGLRSPLTLGLVGCGAVGAFLFTITYLLEGITRAGYDAWQQPISALSLGPGGWVQQVNFVVYGVLLVLSAVGWYRLLTPGRASIWFPLYQSIAGLGLIVAGFFSMDPFPGYPPGVVLTAPTMHGTIHTVCAYVIIIAFANGCSVLAYHFARELRWRGWAVYSALTCVLIYVFWILFVTGSAGPAAGFVERLSAGSHALWSCLLVVTLVLRKRRIEETMK
jgi:Protein of unknown function (DUF998)